MKRFFFGFLLGFVLSHVSGVRAQEEATSHGQHDLTAKDIIEMLGEFDLKHVVKQPFFQPAFGLTDFSSAPPAIWIFNTGDLRSRRSTVLHEFLHIHYHSAGIDVPEEFVRAEEDRQFSALFGALP